MTTDATAPFPRERFSFLAHASMRCCNPISAGKHARAMELLELKPGARVLDIGAGKGALLLDVMERYGAQGIAIEPARLFADELEREAHRRNLSRALTIHRSPAGEALKDGALGTFDAAFCVGATHALGDIHACVGTLASLVSAGGVVLWGEGYWKRPPAPEYLNALGASDADHVSHAGNVELLVRNGLIPTWATTASDDDWDEYEWAYTRNIQRFVSEFPDDPDAAAFAERSWAWRQIVLAWGRDSLGFGFYLGCRSIPRSVNR